MAIINSPLVHLGGLFRVLQCVADGRSFSLLERFSVEGWVDAVRRHRPATASLVPAALRMVLEADLDPDDLRSVRSVVSGTAPLAPDDADAFMARYGVPVLVSYAATEFGGGVAGWNIEDHRGYWAAKRGSVGRAHAGCELRVVDPPRALRWRPTRRACSRCRAGQLGGDRLGAHDGPGPYRPRRVRVDPGAGRPGHHPGRVQGPARGRRRGARAAPGGTGRGSGRLDPTTRLGAVPVAAVELRSGAGDGVTADELLSYAAQVLARYELPTEIRIVDALPRTRLGQGRPGRGDAPRLGRAPGRRLSDGLDVRRRAAAPDRHGRRARAPGHRACCSRSRARSPTSTG